MADKKIRVCTILVVHDGATWLPEVVAALASQTRKVDQTIAIDTGSQDASAKLLSGARIDFSSIERGDGFGTAVATAVKQLPSLNENENIEEWIWLLHDDCAPAPNALEALLAAVENRPNIAMVGPKLIGWNKRDHLLEAGISIATQGARWTGMESDEFDQGQHDGIKEVLSVSTAGALIRRDVYEELGGFDENLAIFRDDVDFGWRIRMAGHGVLVTTDAVARHAQAAFNERRQVDVDEAFLHHAHLLDRRNAAYVLLANSSWWMLPGLVLQISGAAIFRAIGYLLAKLPGYAADEILAIFQLFIRPDLLRGARKKRKINKLLSARVAKPFMPSQIMQLRNAKDDVINWFREKFFPAPEMHLESVSISDDDELLAPQPKSNWFRFLTNPAVGTAALLFVYSILLAHGRLGPIAGGALPETPKGASDLWRLYAESWHQVGMGSGSATPTWVAIVAFIGSLFFGNAQLFTATLFIFAPLILFISIYIWIRKITTHIWLAIFGGLLYSLSPVALGSINSGRLGTMIVLIALPITFNLMQGMLQIELISYRKIFQLGLFLAIPTAFSMPFFISLFIWMALLTSYEWNRIDEILREKRLKLRGLVLAIPFLINLPWTTEAILHPSRFLLEPGLALAGGGPNLAFLSNPGGIGSPPWWLIAPFTAILFGTVISKTNAKYFSYVGLIFVGIAGITSAFVFPAHGSATGVPLWSGTFLAVSTVAAITSGTLVLDKLRENLEASAVNSRHLISGLLLISSVLYLGSSALWSSISKSPLHAITKPVLPEFLGISPGVKTMVFRVNEAGYLNFFVSRDRDIYLGDPDVAPAMNKELSAAVRGTVSGTDINAAKTFEAFGIKYIFVTAPAPDSLIRTIDGVGGFLRNSSTSAGVTWKVVGIPERVLFKNSKNQSIPLPTNAVSANFKVSEKGMIRLAENYDRSWQIIGNGKHLNKGKNEFGLPVFTVDEPGEYLLIHDGTLRRSLISLQLIVLIFALIMAAPAGRRKRDKS